VLITLLRRSAALILNRSLTFRRPSLSPSSGNDAISRVHVSAQRSAILTYVFRGFLQSLQANAGIIS
jgi:hypothetical protein